MYEVPKAEAKITLSGELVDEFKEINASPAGRRPVAGKQYILKTYASFRS